jgi:hypothetical protein
MTKRHQVYVPTNDCLGVDVEGFLGDVTHYDARNGVIETDNSHHANLIRKTLDCGARLVGMPRSAPSVLCDSCGQEIYVAFGPTCWRCRG